MKESDCYLEGHSFSTTKIYCNVYTSSNFWTFVSEQETMDITLESLASEQWGTSEKITHPHKRTLLFVTPFSCSYLAWSGRLALDEESWHLWSWDAPSIGAIELWTTQARPEKHNFLYSCTTFFLITRLLHIQSRRGKALERWDWNEAMNEQCVRTCLLSMEDSEHKILMRSRPCYGLVVYIKTRLQVWHSGGDISFLLKIIAKEDFRSRLRHDVIGAALSRKLAW